MNNLSIPQSNSERQLFIFDFNGNRFRAFRDNETGIWFIGPDVTKILEYANSAQAISDNVDAEDKAYAMIVSGQDIPPISNGFRPGSTVVVNESGLYSLMIRSNKPEAQRFKHWITSEVLPSIRKTGKYEIKPGPRSALDALSQTVQILIQQQNQLDELRQDVGSQALAIENIREELADRDFFTIEQWCSKQGIKTTPSISSKWGKDAKALSRARGIEVKEFYDRRYPNPLGRYHKSVLLDVCVAKPKSNPQQSLFNYDEE